MNGNIKNKKIKKIKIIENKKKYKYKKIKINNKYKTIILNIILFLLKVIII